MNIKFNDVLFELNLCKIIYCFKKFIISKQRMLKCLMNHEKDNSDGQIDVESFV